MTPRKNAHALQFPCECVSVHGGYSDPWADVTRRRLINNGTKERMLNALTRQPKTIAGLAKELRLSQPTVHTHVNEMLSSELLCEAVDWQKKHPLEIYYEPNFPVLDEADRVKYEQLCEEMAVRVAALFESRAAKLEAAFATTALARRGWSYRDVAQYCYANVQRRARALLEQRGALPPPSKHGNGAEWLFWAIEVPLPEKGNRRRAVP